MDNTQWWVISLIVTTLLGAFVSYLLSLGRERRLSIKTTDHDHTTRIGSLETKVAILENTAVSEEKVRLIIHEQIEPLVKLVTELHNSIQDVRESNIRIEATIAQDE